MVQCVPPTHSITHPPSLPSSFATSTEDNNEAGTAEGAAPMNPNNRRVYVGNLSWSTAWQGLKDHMKTVGEGKEMGREGVERGIEGRARRWEGKGREGTGRGIEGGLRPDKRTSK